MWAPILLVSALVACVAGHGRVFAPPSRSSAWRFGFPTPADYDDDGANCGGYAAQHSTNGGKCGICGDAYNIPPPRPHEMGGTYGLGVIVAHYLPGSLITTTVDLTTSHRGFWEFKLCPDPESNEQECFDKYVLATEDGETKYYPTEGSKKYDVTYRLPPGLVCDHCVLQWRYTAGNNWGICPNGTSGLGCGAQEQFGACSDIAIGMSKVMFREGAENDDIPPPLMYYLKNGYFDAQQGILHLLRGTGHPNSVGSNPNSEHQTQQRPSHTKQQEPKQKNQQRPIQNNQRPLQTKQHGPIQTNQQGPIQTNQRPSQFNQQRNTQTTQVLLTQTNEHGPSQTNQQSPQTNPGRQIQSAHTNQHKPNQAYQGQGHPQSIQGHPNQINPHNSRPNIQTSQKLIQSPQNSPTQPAKQGQQSQQTVQPEKLILQQNQSYYDYQRSNHSHHQQTVKNNYSNNNKQPPIQKYPQSNQNQQKTIQKNRQPQPGSIQNLNHSLISHLDTLIQKHRDHQKQLKNVGKSKSIHFQKGQNQNRPVTHTQTIQITSHSVHSYKPHVQIVPPGNLKQWKNGKSARLKKNKRKPKGKGKPRKRKKKVGFEEYNRIIKVGTW